MLDVLRRDAELLASEGIQFPDLPLQRHQCLCRGRRGERFAPFRRRYLGGGRGIDPEAGNFLGGADRGLGFRQLELELKMKSRADIYAAESRFRSKSSSRAADSAALKSGSKTVQEIKRENEVFAPLAPSARIDPSASRRLA